MQGTADKYNYKPEPTSDRLERMNSYILRTRLHLLCGLQRFQCLVRKNIAPWAMPVDKISWLRAQAFPEETSAAFVLLIFVNVTWKCDKEWSFF